MKMKVIRCGGATSWPVVENRPVGAKITHEPEKEIDMFRDGLEPMVQMGDDEVRREYRHGVAKDQIFVSVEDPLLAFGQTIQAEETLSLVCFFFAHVGQTTLDSSGIELEADGKSATG